MARREATHTPNARLDELAEQMPYSVASVRVTSEAKVERLGARSAAAPPTTQLSLAGASRPRVDVA